MAIDTTTLQAYMLVAATLQYTVGILFYVFVGDTLKTFSFGYWTATAAAILTTPLLIGIVAAII